MNSSSNLIINSKAYIYLISLAITCGSFVMGYALVCTSLLQEYIRIDNNIPHDQIQYYLSIIITLLPLGAIFGSLCSKKLIQQIGQKKAMITVDFIMLFAVLLQSLSLQLSFMYVSRFLFGFFCGVSSAVIPSYLTSISPLNMTGIIGSFNQLLITIGISVAYAMDFFLESDTLNKIYEVKIYILLPAIFCIIRISVLMFVFPYDTIERHFKKNQLKKVEQIINLIYLNPNYNEYCKSKNLVERQKNTNNETQMNEKPSASLSSAKKRIFCLTIILAISNQLCGINAIFFYAKQLFTTITNNDQQQVKISLFSLGLFQVVITYLSALFLDKFGRRSLMLIGQSIVIFSLFGAYVATDLFHLPTSYVALFVFLHILGFSISIGPISILYASEIIQDFTHMIILLWTLTLAVAMVSDIMISSLGIGRTFLSFGIISLACFIYLFKQMIQTKGLNRKQIQMRFQGKCGTFRLNSTEQFQQMEQIVSNQDFN